MAFDMSTVKEIKIPGPLYKKTIYLTHESVVYKGTSTPCPVEVTIYSKAALTTTITESNFSSYLKSCGYSVYNSKCYLIVDNPYEFTYNNGTYDCVFASLQIVSGSTRMWFSVPEATSTGVLSKWTITEDPWQEVGSYPTFTYEYKTYLNSTAGSYTNFTVGKNYMTGDEYIASYCINGVSYPDVTIESVSGNTYTLSNQEVLTITGNYSSTISSGKECIKIQDSNNVVIWEKPYEPSWHTLWSGSRQIKTTGSYNNNGTVTGDGITLVNAVTIPTDTVKLRITFTNYSASGDGYQSYTEWIPSPKQSSPYTVTKNTTSSLTDLIGVIRRAYSNNAHTSSVSSRAILQYSFNSNHQLTIKTKAEFYKSEWVGSGSATDQITIKKIEAQY